MITGRQDKMCPAGTKTVRNESVPHSDNSTPPSDGTSIENVRGIGPKYASHLKNRVGISTAEELAPANPEEIEPYQ